MHDDCEARITVSLSITNLRPAIILLGECVGFNVPLDTLYVIPKTILRVR